MSLGLQPAAIGRWLRFFSPTKLLRALRKRYGYVKLLLYVIIAIIIGGMVSKKLHKKRSTFVFASEDVRRVWEWEIESGHFMSWRPSRQTSLHLPCGTLIFCLPRLAASTSEPFAPYS